ncbi:MAG: pseudouridine synthase [bacterium]
MRIQKYLSQQGRLSRREAERYMREGWVKVNGVVVTVLGSQIDPVVDCVTLHAPAEKTNTCLLAFHKPVGIVSHSPQNDEKEIKDLLPENYHSLSPIGRLDKASSGLILLTDDGVLARKLLQGDTPHTRRYIVTTSSELTSGQQRKCEKGLVLFGQKTKPVSIKRVGDKCYEWTMIEGKNRQIRRMIQKVGSSVLGLKRVSFGPYVLGDLGVGAYCVVDVSLMGK